MKPGNEVFPKIVKSIMDKDDIKKTTDIIMSGAAMYTQEIINGLSPICLQDLPLVMAALMNVTEILRDVDEDDYRTAKVFSAMMQDRMEVHAYGLNGPLKKKSEKGGEDPGFLAFQEALKDFMEKEEKDS